MSTPATVPVGSHWDGARLGEWEDRDMRLRELFKETPKERKCDPD